MSLATTTRTLATSMYTFKNKKGETLAIVEGTSATDAQYRAGVNSASETTNTSVADTAPVRINSVTGHQE